MTKDPVAEILELLACPCPQHGSLRREESGFVSSCCARHFRIEEGIPVLLIEDK